MLQVICNWIILIGAVCLAIGNILRFCGKPITFAKKKQEEIEHKKQEEITKAVTDDISSTILPLLKNIQQQNDEQNNIIQTLADSNRDILRKNILEIYEEGKITGSLTVAHKETLDEMYEQYTKLGGNGHIKLLYEIMKTWRIMPN